MKYLVKFTFLLVLIFTGCDDPVSNSKKGGGVIVGSDFFIISGNPPSAKINELYTFSFAVEGDKNIHSVQIRNTSVNSSSKEKWLDAYPDAGTVRIAGTPTEVDYHRYQVNILLEDGTPEGITFPIKVEE